ncbi:M28 family peptidase [Pseudonocardia hierapolitana]|uniref:M28 family peptidase n=1 Tax=Pseudonocardia hierapolitana TaxID=1128676 RepID=UPI0014784FBF|nr:M28 family peptidase [Pseudonocardia hierapolitana]
MACVLVEQLAATGVVAKTTELDRESDYAPFVDASIPTGGVTGGRQVERLRSRPTAGVRGPANGVRREHHTRRDRLAHLDRTALDRFIRAVAGTVTHFAMSTATRLG